jgi:protein SCO1
MMALVVLASLAASDPRLAVGLDEHVGATLPQDLAFTDSTGHHVELRDLFVPHRPVVLVMAYARCQMLCSVVLHGVADAIAHSRHAIGTDYLPVVVSLDPKETAATGTHRQGFLLAQVHHAGERARWPYLVGDDHDVTALADALGFRYAWDPQTEQYAHPAVVFVLTPDGRIAEYLRGVQYDTLDDAIDRAAIGVVTTSTAHDLLACFHFDPSLRRYGWQIQLFLRLGAATVAVSLAALVIGLTLWNRRRRT